MKAVKKAGLKNVWVSNGYFSKETLEAIAPYLDAINIDLKSMSDRFYRENCGARVRPVLDNLKRVVAKRIWLEVTTLIIPGYNNDIENLQKLARFIRWEVGNFVPWHVSAFSAANSWKLRDVPDTRPDQVMEAAEIGRKHGLKYVYAGNISAENADNTVCDQCGAVAVSRSGYFTERLDRGGKCNACGAPVEGVWK
jgi:pyruvate formate lyase activating enzyme